MMPPARQSHSHRRHSNRRSAEFKVSPSPSGQASFNDGENGRGSPVDVRVCADLHTAVFSRRSSLHLSRRVDFHSRFRLLQKLGKGGFASVYAVEDRANPSDRLVVKVLDLRVVRNGRPVHGEVRGKLQQVVQKEAAALKMVSGLNNCVRFVEFNVEDTWAYLVMERCDVTLYTMLEQMPCLNESSLTGVFWEMTEALRTIHCLGLIHRDVKPENYFCSGPCRTVKLGDFGLSECERLARPGEPAPSMKGVFGTAPFMSPEMLLRSGFNRMTDMWSLGVSMYTITIGEFPYVPAKICASAMKAAIAVGYPAPSFRSKESMALKSGSGGTSPCCKALIQMLLCRDPQRRLNAEDALAHEWFTRGVAKCQESLKPILLAAKRVGAFEAVAVPKQEPIDFEMQELQVQHHRQDLQSHPLLVEDEPVWWPQHSVSRSSENWQLHPSSRASTVQAASEASTGPPGGSTAAGACKHYDSSLAADVKFLGNCALSL